MLDGIFSSIGPSKWKIRDFKKVKETTDNVPFVVINWHIMIIKSDSIFWAILTRFCYSFANTTVQSHKSTIRLSSSSFSSSPWKCRKAVSQHLATHHYKWFQEIRIPALKTVGCWKCIFTVQPSSLELCYFPEIFTEVLIPPENGSFPRNSSLQEPYTASCKEAS